MKLFKPTDKPYRYSPWLLATVVTVCAVPNVWLSITEPLSLIQAITNIVLPVGVYTLLMSVTPRVGRATLWMILLMFFGAFQMVLLYMYGRSIIAVDMFLNVATTNPGEVSELLGNIVVIIAVVVSIYIPTIVAGIAAVIKKWRLSADTLRHSRKAGLWLTGIGLILFALSFTSERRYRPGRDLYPVNVINNLGKAVSRATALTNYSETSHDFTYNARATVPDSLRQVYILMIGETSRADNWQLFGYKRPTTPELMGRKDLVAFPRAVSQSNTTHKSVPMMLSPLDATNFGDSINYVKSLLTAFKEAGFRTAYLSNQNRNHSYIDFFAQEADTCIFLSDRKSVFDTKNFDTDLLPLLDDQLATGARKQLIVLHLYGSHFNYIDRYPKGYGSFKPDGPAKATHHYRTEQINAYDNTIQFTSKLISDVISRADSINALSGVIFTSDHGEDIFDDERRLFLHASPIPSYYQIHVPFLVWLSDNYTAMRPEAADALRANSDKFVASTATLFHTVMDLAGIDTRFNRPGKSLLNPAYSAGHPLYINDHNEAVPLEECGILECDIENFRKLGVL